MLILHLALQGGFYGVLRPWVEADAAEKERAKHLRCKRPTVPVTVTEHPHNGGPDLLYSVLPGAPLSDGLARGAECVPRAWRFVGN